MKPNHPVNKAKPTVTAFFESVTNTVSYVVKEPDSNNCAIVDSVLNFDYSSGRIEFDHANAIIDFVKDNALETQWILETHVHADHLSAAPYLQEKLGGQIGIGAKITEVQTMFGKVFNEGTEFERDGSQFDKLFYDGDQFSIGNMVAQVIHTPGHTPACMSYVIGDAVFVGDTLFMPDSGTARADFPGGDAGILFDSIQKLFTLPDETRLFMCHDYAPGGREISWETTVAEEKKHNIHVGRNATREAFIQMRTERDSQLDFPKLILPSLQVNMRAGEIPKDKDGNERLKVPVNAL